MKLRFRMTSSVVALMAIALTYPTNTVGRNTLPKKSGKENRRSISLVVEVGHVLPSLLLGKIGSRGEVQPTSLPERPIVESTMELPDQIEPGEPVDVTFTIAYGGARFEDQDGIISTVTVADGVVSLPAIIPGAVYDESSITVLIGGRRLVDDLRVVSLRAGAISKLMLEISTNDPALIAFGDYFAVVDESKLTDISDETVSGQGQLLGRRREVDDQVTTQGLCIIRTPQGPGKVEWYIANPARAGFSYKPEGPLELRWATAPSNKIDGIYNKNWGCGVALKVPDSCTVSWYSSSSFSWCCNKFLADYFGKVPTWVNPGAIGWKNCPLR